MTLFSVAVRDPAAVNEGSPRRHAKFANGPLVDFPPEAKTLYENFLHGLKESGNSKFMGYRPLHNGVAG